MPPAWSWVGPGGMVPTGPPRVWGCCAPGEKWGEWMARYVAPVSKTRLRPGKTRLRPAKTRLRPPSPENPKSCRACWGSCPDVLLLSMTRFPARGHPSPAGEDPFSGQGTPVSGRRRPVSGHRLRAACQAGGRAGAASPRRVRGIHLPSPCRGAAAPARPPSWLASRPQWPLPELASWRPG